MLLQPSAVLSPLKQLLTRCICRLFLKELRLLDLLAALRRYFFMEAGDWAGALTEGLCRLTAEGADLQEHALQDALSDALRGSSCEGDVYAGECVLVTVAALGEGLPLSGSRLLLLQEAGQVSMCVHLKGVHSIVAAHTGPGS